MGCIWQTLHWKLCLKKVFLAKLHGNCVEWMVVLFKNVCCQIQIACDWGYVMRKTLKTDFNRLQKYFVNYNKINTTNHVASSAALVKTQPIMVHLNPLQSKWLWWKQLRCTWPSRKLFWGQMHHPMKCPFHGTISSSQSSQFDTLHDIRWLLNLKLAFIYNKLQQNNQSHCKNKIPSRKNALIFNKLVVQCSWRHLLSVTNNFRKFFPRPHFSAPNKKIKNRPCANFFVILKILDPKPFFKQPTCVSP